MLKILRGLLGKANYLPKSSARMKMMFGLGVWLNVENRLQRKRDDMALQSSAKPAEKT